MAAPPGFNPNASVLPDPGASSAPMHVMRGGGMKGGSREELLRAYHLGPGQELAGFSEEDKNAFVQALESGKCNWQVSSITNAKCAPVVKVLKALLNKQIKEVNSREIPRLIGKEGFRYSPKTVRSGFPDIFRMGRRTTPRTSPERGSGITRNPLIELTGASAKKGKEEPVVRPEDVPIVVHNAPGSGSGNSNAQAEGQMANNNSPLSGFSDELFEASPERVINQNLMLRTTVNTPKANYRGNRSRRTANIRLNLTRKNKRVFSNFNINSKPMRIYGNSPQNIAARYNHEVVKSKKNTQKRLENMERAKRNAQVQKQKVAWEKQAQKETVKSVKGRLNEEIAALKAQKKSLPQTKKFYQFWKGGKKTRRGNRK